MDFKDIAKSVAHAALDKTMDGKNIGEIAEAVAETAVEELAKENSASGPQEIPTPSDEKGGDLISNVVSLLVKFVIKLFK